MNIKDLKSPKIVNAPINVRDLNRPTVVKSETQKRDEESAKSSWAVFPNKTENTSVSSNLFKAIGNTPGSALNLAVNALKAGGAFLLFDNPISKTLNIGQDKSILNAVGKVAQGEIAKATGMTGGNEEAVGASDAFRGEMSKNFGTWEGYKQLGEELIKGKIAQGIPENQAAAETLQTLQRYFVNNPFSGGADVAGVIGSGASIFGKTEKVANAASKAANLVTAPVSDTKTLLGAGVKAVKNKATDIVTPMPEGTVKALETSGGTRFDEYLNQAKLAAKDYHLPTALEIAGKKAEDALSIMQKIIKVAGKKKTAIVETIADQSVGNIASMALYDLRNKVAARIGAGITKDGSLVQLKGRVINVSDPADLTLLNIAYRKINEIAQTPTFRKVDDTIDFLQDILYKRETLTAVPVNKKVNGLLKEIIGELNDGLKEVGGVEYRALNSTIAETKKAFDGLNKALGLEGSKGGSLMKRVFSPTDGGTKKLFNDVRGITGIDLVDEATLAKLAMEIVGDSRQSGLLEQMSLLINPSKGSAIMETGKWLLDKLQNQETKAKNIINKATGKKKLNLKTPDAYSSNIKPGLTIKDVTKTSDDILMAEAKKYKSAEEFVKANDLGTAGIKFHITDDPNFKIDKNIIPSDLPAGLGTKKVLSKADFEKQLSSDIRIFRERSIKTEPEIKKYLETQRKIYEETSGGGGLMVTRGLEPWLEEGVLSGNRKYVAIIDTTDAPLKDLTRSTRGFGDEIFIKNPQNAKVLKIVPIKEALKLQKQSQSLTKSQLTEIWNKAHSKTTAIKTLDPKDFKSAEEFVRDVMNNSNIGLQGEIRTIPINKIKGTDYPELDNALLSNKKLSVDEAEDIISATDDYVVGQKVKYPIEVIDNKDGTYSLVAGNHRLAQKLINGETDVIANISNVKGKSTKSQLTEIWNKAHGKK